MFVVCIFVFHELLYIGAIFAARSHVVFSLCCHNVSLASADYFDTNVLPVLIYFWCFYEFFVMQLFNVQSIRVFICAFASVLVCNVKFLGVEVLQVL